MIIKKVIFAETLGRSILSKVSINPLISRRFSFGATILFSSTIVNLKEKLTDTLLSKAFQSFSFLSPLKNALSLLESKLCFAIYLPCSYITRTSLQRAVLA